MPLLLFKRLMPKSFPEEVKTWHQHQQFHNDPHDSPKWPQIGAVLDASIGLQHPASVENNSNDINTKNQVRSPTASPSGHWRHGIQTVYSSSFLPGDPLHRSHLQPTSVTLQHNLAPSIPPNARPTRKQWRRRRLNLDAAAQVNPRLSPACKRLMTEGRKYTH